MNAPGCRCGERLSGAASLPAAVCADIPRLGCAEPLPAVSADAAGRHVGRGWAVVRDGDGAAANGHAGCRSDSRPYRRPTEVLAVALLSTTLSKFRYGWACGGTISLLIGCGSCAGNRTGRAVARCAGGARGSRATAANAGLWHDDGRWSGSLDRSQFGRGVATPGSPLAVIWLNAEFFALAAQSSTATAATGADACPGTGIIASSGLSPAAADLRPDRG